MNSKTCSQCQVTKDLCDFAKAKSCVGGYRTNCKSCQKIKKDLWRKANSEHHNEKSRQWALNNPEARKESRTKWAKANLVFFGSRKRQVRLATPSWADGKAITELYYLAREQTERLGQPFHVDHIIPILGKLVCGLHVENNLRVIPAKDNIVKGNRYAII